MYNFIFAKRSPSRRQKRRNYIHTHTGKRAAVGPFSESREVSPPFVPSRRYEPEIVNRRKMRIRSAEEPADEEERSRETALVKDSRSRDPPVLSVPRETTGEPAEKRYYGEALGTDTPKSLSPKLHRRPHRCAFILVRARSSNSFRSRFPYGSRLNWRVTIINKLNDARRVPRLIGEFVRRGRLFVILNFARNFRHARELRYFYLFSFFLT